MLIAAARYADGEAALRFLRDVVGLSEHAVYRDDAGKIVHGQMQLGDGLFMFGPTDQPGPFAQHMIAPSDTGGRATVSIYAVMADVAACHDRLHAAGAEILVAQESQGHGGIAFSFRDPGGHVWTVGDYDPLA